MKLMPYILSIFLLSLSAVFAQQNPTTSLYAVPLLAIFVTSMIVVIVWLMYKDKLEGAVKK